MAGATEDTMAALVEDLADMWSTEVQKGSVHPATIVSVEEGYGLVLLLVTVGSRTSVFENMLVSWACRFSVSGGAVAANFMRGATRFEGCLPKGLAQVRQHWRRIEDLIALGRRIASGSYTTGTATELGIVLQKADAAFKEFPLTKDHRTGIANYEQTVIAKFDTEVGIIAESVKNTSSMKAFIEKCRCAVECYNEWNLDAVPWLMLPQSAEDQALPSKVQQSVSQFADLTSIISRVKDVMVEWATDALRLASKACVMNCQKMSST